MDKKLLDTAIRNVAARKGQSQCLYLNKEEVQLLEIEIAELEYEKHQQDKIDYGEEYDPTSEEVS